MAVSTASIGAWEGVPGRGTGGRECGGAFGDWVGSEGDEGGDSAGALDAATGTGGDFAWGFCLGSAVGVGTGPAFVAGTGPVAAPIPGEGGIVAGDCEGLGMGGLGAGGRGEGGTWGGERGWGGAGRDGSIEDMLDVHVRATAPAGPCSGWRGGGCCGGEGGGRRSA